MSQSKRLVNEMQPLRIDISTVFEIQRNIWWSGLVWYVKRAVYPYFYRRFLGAWFYLSRPLNTSKKRQGKPASRPKPSRDAVTGKIDI